MAASGLPISSGNARQIPPLPRAPSRNLSFQRNPSCRVLFSKTPTTPKHHSRTLDSSHENNNIFPEMPPKKHQPRIVDEDNIPKSSTKPRARDWDSNDKKRGCRGRRLCYAWTSLVIGCLVLVLMILGALSLSFIKGALLEFRVKSLNISRLEISKKDENTLLTSKVEVLVNATNKNDRYDLLYSALSVEVSSEDIKMGTKEVAAFKQGPKKASVLNVATEVKKSVVDDAAADDLKSNHKEKQVVIDVVFKGSITVIMEGRKLSGLPLKVLCTGIQQVDIDNGLQPQCRVKMFNFL